MRVTPVSLAVAALLAGLAGCGPREAPPGDGGAPPAVVIPGPDEVTAVVVSVEGGPGNERLFPGAPFELRLTRREDVAEVLDWLKETDWSRPGKDIKAMKLGLGGRIEVVCDNGTTLRFLYTWDGTIYQNRLRGADTTRLKELIRRLRKEGAAGG